MTTYTKWPIVHNKHLEALAAVGVSGEWHYGKVFERLESRLSQWLGRPVSTTSSCAWSLFLALRAIGATGKIVVPAYGYYGTVHPVIWAGAEPLFVDCDPSTFNICPQDLHQTLRLNSVTAVIGVHIHGMPFDYHISELCTEFGVPLIEDVCQAQGARLRDRLAGTIGDLAAFSFNTRKTLPAGLGGALATRSDAVWKRVQELRNYGAKDYDDMPTEIGSYLPIGEFDAALALIQMDDLDRWIKRSYDLAMIVRDAIPERFPHVPTDRTHTWHKLRIKGTENDRVRLQSSGVLTSKWGARPLTDYPCYASYLHKGVFPGAEEICQTTFCLFDDDYPLMAQTDETVCKLAGLLHKELK